jgi:nicotinate-nucleotide adenylyltransferase
MGRRVGVKPTVTTARWGILGGIFDPIHYAHLAIAEQARDALDLERVVFVPAGTPVHRAPARATADDRARMVELAIADNPSFILSRLEVDTDRPSYTVDTLATMAAQVPDVEPYLIVSAETAALMPTTWREPERILDLARIAIASRLGFPDITPAWLAEHFPGRAERFTMLQTSLLGHSSSDIRARLAAGKSIRYLVPPAVENFIGEHHLYADDRPAA